LQSLRLDLQLLQWLPVPAPPPPRRVSPRISLKEANHYARTAARKLNVYLEQVHPAFELGGELTTQSVEIPKPAPCHNHQERPSRGVEPRYAWRYCTCAVTTVRAQMTEGEEPRVQIKHNEITVLVGDNGAEHPSELYQPHEG
jgi:hypothetical protein